MDEEGRRQLDEEEGRRKDVERGRRRRKRRRKWRSIVFWDGLMDLSVKRGNVEREIVVIIL